MENKINVHDIMNKTEKIKNIFAFLSLLFGEEQKEIIEIILRFSPDYLIEKFERYILSDRYQADWGLHPALRDNIFNLYCEKYNLPITDKE